MRNRSVEGLKLLILPLLVAVCVRIWYATCRIKIHNLDCRQEAEQSGLPIIRTVWHYCVLGIFAIYRNNPLVIMVSASGDGDYLARLLKLLGFSVVRGSSNSHGAKAAIELIKQLRAGKNCGLVADGSQGPVKVAQAGPLLLSAKSGGTILPMAYSASRYYTFNTWDRLILPKPFSTIHVVYGKPFTIPRTTKAFELEGYLPQLESNLNGLYDEAWGICGKENH